MNDWIRSEQNVKLAIVGANATTSAKKDDSKGSYKSNIFF